jgi:hypothetical protein
MADRRGLKALAAWCFDSQAIVMKTNNAKARTMEANWTYSCSFVVPMGFPYHLDLSMVVEMPKLSGFLAVLCRALTLSLVEGHTAAVVDFLETVIAQLSTFDKD